MLVLAGAYYILINNQKKFSYLENQRNIKELAQAFQVIKSKNNTEKPGLKLSKDSYESFLNKNNSYHALLSYKILHKTKLNPQLMIKIEQHEKDYNLKYIAEIEKILREGNFSEHIDEERFLIEELTPSMPDEIINITESKLYNSVLEINNNENTDDTYFKYILALYLEQIRKSQIIDEAERSILLRQKIKSPKVRKFLNEVWPTDH